MEYFLQSERKLKTVYFFQWLLSLSLCRTRRKQARCLVAWAPRESFSIASLRSPASITKNIPERDPSAQGKMVSGWHKSGTVGEAWGSEVDSQVDARTSTC